MFTAIKRNVNASLRSRVQQALARRIFPHRSNKIGFADSLHGLLPRFSKISRPKARSLESSRAPVSNPFHPAGRASNPRSLLPNSFLHPSFSAETASPDKAGADPVAKKPLESSS